MGSGFVIESSGYIQTNTYVVDGATEINVKFSDKRERSARVIGADTVSGIALIKADAKDLPTVKIGRADTLRVGAMGDCHRVAVGFEQSASQGIVSALGRSLPGDACVPFVQTDVPINPGNSGGPLIDLAGRVVGVNSQIDSQSGGYQGGCLGRPGSRPAAVAGIKQGDVIRSYHGKAIVEASDLPPKVAVTPPGHDAALDVWRNGQSLGIDVTIAPLPEPTAKKG